MCLLVCVPDQSNNSNTNYETNKIVSNEQHSMPYFNMDNFLRNTFFE